MTALLIKTGSLGKLSQLQGRELLSNVVDE